MNVSPRSNSIMRAAVFHGREHITIEPVAIPEVAAGEVLVRISRTVEAVDAYAFAIGAGLAVRDAMAFAAATAALKCKHSGGRAGIPSIDDCLAFMRTNQ